MGTTIYAAKDIPLADLKDWWLLYERRFADIDADAVQRHLMTEREFTEVMLDPRVLKYLAVDSLGTKQGMAVMTNELEAWPLVSPRFFKKHFFQDYESKRIWYIGFVFTEAHNLVKQTNLYSDLIRAMYAEVERTKGMAVMDFCDYNYGTRRMGDIAEKVMLRLNETTVSQVLDAQTFMALRFNWWKYDQ